jgi:hypothetical protein
MRKKLGNLATAASVALCLLSTVMWVRSQSTDEAWVSEPRVDCRYAWEPGYRDRGPLARWHPGSQCQVNWHRYRVVGSADGRLVFVAFEEFGGYGWLPAPTRPTGFQPAGASMLNRDTYVPLAAVNTIFRVPGVIEWAAAPATPVLTYYPRPMGPRRYLSVSWLVLVAVFAAMPAARAWSRWSRRSHRPTFPVITPDATEGAR